MVETVVNLLNTETEKLTKHKSPHGIECTGVNKSNVCMILQLNRENI